MSNYTKADKIEVDTFVINLHNNSYNLFCLYLMRNFYSNKEIYKWYRGFLKNIIRSIIGFYKKYEKIEHSYEKIINTTIFRNS